MQQTSFDHWIKAKFVFIYEIMCNSLPPNPLPFGVTAQPVRDTDMFNEEWRYVLYCPNERAFEQTTARLRLARSTYLPRVRRRKGFVMDLLSPPRNGSLTYNMIWNTTRLAAVVCLFVFTPLASFLQTFPCWFSRILTMFRLSFPILILVLSLASMPPLLGRSKDASTSVDVLASLDMPIGKTKAPKSGGQKEYVEPPLPVKDDALLSEAPPSVASSVSWSTPRVFTVRKRLVVTEDRTMQVAADGTESIVVIRDGATLRVQFDGKHTAEFQIYDDTAKIIVDNAFGEGASAVMDCIRAARVSGGRMENISLTERSCTLTATAFRRDDATITFASREGRGAGLVKQ